MAIIMTETSPRSKRHLKFKDLQIGDIFTEDSGLWWFKTVKMSTDRCEFNAVTLDGHMDLIPEEENVSKLNKDLTVAFSSDDLIEWV